MGTKACLLGWGHVRCLFSSYTFGTILQTKRAIWPARNKCWMISLLSQNKTFHHHSKFILGYCPLLKSLTVENTKEIFLSYGKKKDNSSSSLAQITTTDLDITAGLITAGLGWTGSDVPSLSVLSLKIRKWWGLGQNWQWRSTSLPVCGFAPVVAWCLLITAGSSQELSVMLGYHCRF